MSSCLPQPIGTRPSIAFDPVCISSCTYLRAIILGAFTYDAEAAKPPTKEKIAYLYQRLLNRPHSLLKSITKTYREVT